MNKFEISQAIPLKPYHQSDLFNAELGADLKVFNPNLNYRNLDEDFYFRNIPDLFAKQKYFQKWQNGDSINFQFLGLDYYTPIITPVNPYLFNLIDCNGNIIKSIEPTKIDTLPDGRIIWEVKLPLYDIVEGKYLPQLSCSGNALSDPYTYIIFEPIHVKELHEKTSLLVYRNTSNNNGIFYETGIFMMLRVDGSITDIDTNSEFSVYKDDPNNTTFLGGVRYRQYLFETEQLPTWYADKLEHIFNSDVVYLNDLAVTKIEGAKIDTSKNKQTKLQSCKINLADRYNDKTLIINSFESIKIMDLPTSGAYYVESFTLFGSTTPIEKYFIGSKQLLNYLNSVVWTYLVPNTYFSLNDRNELIFTTSDENINTLYSTFTLNNVIHNYLEFDFDSTQFHNFNMEIIQNTSTNIDYAFFYNDGSAPILGSNFGGFIENKTLNNGKFKGYLFFSHSDSFDFSNCQDVIISVGGNLPIEVDNFPLENNSLHFINNNLFLHCNSIQNISFALNKLNSLEVNKVILYMFESQLVNCNLDLTGQNPLSTISNDIGIKYMKNYLENKGCVINID